MGRVKENAAFVCKAIGRQLCDFHSNMLMLERKIITEIELGGATAMLMTRSVASVKSLIARLGVYIRV